MDPSIISPNTVKAGKNLDDVISSMSHNHDEGNDYFKVKKISIFSNYFHH